MFRAAVSAVLATVMGAAYADAYMDSGPQVIHIHVYGTLKKPLPSTATLDFHERGTGFFVSPNGLILTAGHIIPDASLFDEEGFQIVGMLPVRDVDRLNAEAPQYTLEVVSATTLPFDVGLLRMKGAKFPTPFLRLCNGYRKGDGTRFPILGYQGGDILLTTNWGGVSAGAGAMTNIQIDTDINGGNSGGPIFNESGLVFGIAIGEKEVGGKRMDNASLVVPMDKIISTLGEKARPLVGTSYDPDCQKVPNRQVATALDIGVKVKQVELTYGGILGGGTSLVVNSIDDMVKAPSGYKWVRIDAAHANGKKMKTGIINEGSEVWVTGETDLTSDDTANLTLKAILEPLPVKPTSKTVVEIRTFPYSKTLDTHGGGVTRKEFIDKIPAPDGFIFAEVVRIDYQSLNKSPSNGAKIQISTTGDTLELTYTLESGPIYDRWRGWIDAYITAKLVAKAEAHGKLSGNGLLGR
jgi:serine protease Do